MKYTISFITFVAIFPLSRGFLLTGGVTSSIYSLQGRHRTSTFMSTNVESESPRTLIRKGMQFFRDGDISSSLDYFDRADNAVPDGSLRPYLWQRGISYYYLDKFREGSDQARYIYSYLSYHDLLSCLAQPYIGIRCSVSVRCVCESIGRRRNSRELLNLECGY